MIRLHKIKKGEITVPKKIQIESKGRKNRQHFTQGDTGFIPRICGNPVNIEREKNNVK